MFEPSRFLPGAPQPARFAYMPFGIGRRTCIGTQFTLTELVLGLATMDRAFRIDIAEPRQSSRDRRRATYNPPPFLLQRRQNSVAAVSL